MRRAPKGEVGGGFVSAEREGRKRLRMSRITHSPLLNCRAGHKSSVIHWSRQCFKTVFVTVLIFFHTLHTGVLLHYDDPLLRDLYFLDPQWLCDMLAHVVTIREVNPHINNGTNCFADTFYFNRRAYPYSGGWINAKFLNLVK